ncbi:unnamed protein product [Adineta steineri]|uniref:G-protein coupled receptors family 1 profile domain-containing protein n=2 Tax=Adineta steineri TaxID=433720 RepID=A0A818V682_9BILA|nr:unnamed protein product [Adineta steineri]
MMNDNQIVIILVIIKVVILALISAGSILYALPLCFNQRFYTSIHLFTLNICITIFLCATFWMIYYIMNTFYSNILWTEQSCLLILYLQTMVNCQFLYALCIVSLNRLIAILNLHKRLFRTKTWIIRCIIVQWITGILLPLPQFDSSLMHCLISGLDLNYQIYALCIGGILPAILLAVTNIIIFKFVHHSTRRVQPMNNNDNTILVTTLSQRYIRLLKHIIFMFVILICGWIPAYIVGAIDWNGTAISYVVFHGITMLPCVSLIINVIDLFIFNRKLRKYFLNILRNNRN